MSKSSRMLPSVLALFAHHCRGHHQPQGVKLDSSAITIRVGDQAGLNTVIVVDSDYPLLLVHLPCGARACRSLFVVDVWAF